MIPCTEVTLCGKKYYPLYNLQAMFRLQDSFSQEVLDEMGENSEAGCKLAFAIFRLLCEEGNAARQAYGHEVGALPDWDSEFWKRELLPADMLKVKAAVYAAINLGCSREFPSEEDTDLTLIELQKKTE